MPTIIIESWPMEKERKKEVIKKITEVFTGIGIPKHAVTVIIHESSMDNWGTEGEIHSEKFKDLKK
nr:tautomerase family protein [Nanoarchaeota archaeon]